MSNALIVLYAILLMIGGIMGFLKGGSTVSLLMGSIFGVMLLICSWLIERGYRIALVVALFLLVALAFLFGYRFSLHQQIWPAGVMLGGAIISVLSLLPRCLRCTRNPG